jgi:hypothetical protein
MYMYIYIYIYIYMYTYIGIANERRDVLEQNGGSGVQSRVVVEWGPSGGTHSNSSALDILVRYRCGSYIYMHINIYIYIYIYMYIHIYTYIYTYVTGAVLFPASIYIYIYTCMYIHVTGAVLSPASVASIFLCTMIHIRSNYMRFGM